MIRLGKKFLCYINFMHFSKLKKKSKAKLFASSSKIFLQFTLKKEKRRQSVLILCFFSSLLLAYQLVEWNLLISYFLIFQAFRKINEVTTKCGISSLYVVTNEVTRHRYSSCISRDTRACCKGIGFIERVMVED